jgi:hypothetical protein
VAQSAPDPQMFAGRGQLEREQRQGEGPRLGIPGGRAVPPRTLKPPLQTPLEESLLLALPLLGGRAGAFSRRPGPVRRLLFGVGLRPTSAPPLGVRGAKIGSLGGTIGLEAMRPLSKLSCLQRLIDARFVVAEEVGERRLANLQRRLDGLRLRRFASSDAAPWCPG